MEYHQKTFKQNHCPVNSLEKNLILTGLKDQKKIADRLDKYDRLYSVKISSCWQSE